MDLAGNEALRLKTFLEDYSDWQYEPSTIIIQDALVVPQTVQGFDEELRTRARVPFLHFNGGVYTSDGEIVEQAIHQNARGLRHVPDASSHAGQAKQIAGTWLFGGFAYRQIGHMLTESVGRLWALEANLNKLAGIVFVAANGFYDYTGQKSLTDWVTSSSVTTRDSTSFQQFIKIFAHGLPVQLVGQAVQVEKLVVPSQLMGLLPYRELVGGHSLYRQYVRDQLRKLRLVGGDLEHKRIFSSRSRFFKPGTAEILNEVELDEQFSSQGYRVIHPETMTLADQLRAYALASHIVFSAGSAAHVAALAMDGTQNVALLRRYEGQQDIFAHQLSLMGSKSVTTIDVLNGRLLPSIDSNLAGFKQKKPQGTYSIDIKALSEELLEKEFIYQPLVEREIGAPSPHIKKFADRLEKEFDTPFTIRPLKDGAACG